MLVGDASDGLPGVAGIGAKTAAALLVEHGDLDGVLAAAADPSSALSPRRRSALTEAGDYLEAARGVVRLRSRSATLEIDGDADGRLGPADQSALDELGDRTGQVSAIRRLQEGLGHVRGL